MGQRLCEVPYLARNGELADRMRDRERLRKLRSPHLSFIVLLLNHEAIQVEVKTTQVVTQQDGCALDERAEVELRRGAGIKTPQVLAGDRRPPIVAWQDDRLHACEDLSRPVTRNRRAATVREGLEQSERFHPLVDAEFRHLIDAETFREFRRISRVQDAVLELQIAHRGQRCRS